MRCEFRDVPRKYYLRGTSLIFFACITLQLPSPDTYAIYSGLIVKAPAVRTGIGNVPTEDEIYLIESTTVTSLRGFGPPRGRSLEPADSCVQAPPADAAGLREILEDYNQRKNRSSVLMPQFTFSKPYRLLSTVEIERFLKDALEATPQVVPAGMPRPVNRNPLYQKSKRVFRLGDVYFNRAHTLALVYFSVYSTSMDGSGGWKSLRKTVNGQWEVNNSWTSCGWSIAR
jgi:hypothetical protein